MTLDPRYLRHVGLFGAEGQRKIDSTEVAIVGLGGLGCHVAQQLAYLGVGTFLLVEADAVSPSNLNRLVGATLRDVGVPKVDVARRMISLIRPEARITTVPREFVVGDPELSANFDVVFGCVDQDPTRFDLVRHATVRAMPYIDLASDVTSTGEFGGRIVFAKDGARCLSCLGELDQHALARAQMTDEQREADDRIYGIRRDALQERGPSVVSINGVVASLAVTEFMVWVTGLREPRGYLNYRGDHGTVGVRSDPERGYCHYCMTLWGSET